VLQLVVPLRNYSYNFFELVYVQRQSKLFSKLLGTTYYTSVPPEDKWLLLGLMNNMTLKSQAFSYYHNKRN